MSDEHAIPGWASECVPGEGAFTHKRQAGGEWVADLFNLKVAHVCKVCNEGWMSRLEGRSKRVLCGALAGHAVTWSVKEARLVATWITKTAFVTDLASGGSRVPHEHYRIIRENLSPPPRVRVWATIYGESTPSDTFEVTWIQPTWLTFTGLRTGTQSHGYGITMNVGHLAFQVLGYVGGEEFNFIEPALLGHDAGAYNLRLWPPTNEVTRWPPPCGFDRGGLVEYAGRWMTAGSILRRH